MGENNSGRCVVCDGDNYKVRRNKNGFEMRECLDCSVGYTNPLVAGNEHEVGNQNSSTTDYRMMMSYYEIQSALAKEKAPLMRDYWKSIIGREPKSILEIGCGTGQYFEAWKDLGMKWQGVDVNSDMLAFCQSKNMPVMSFEEFIKTDEKYDVIFLSQCFEHILEPYEFLNKIRKFLAVGGIIHMDVPNHNSLTAWYRKINVFHDHYGFIEPPHHLIAYTQKSLSMLLQKSNYEIVYVGTHANDHPLFGQLLASMPLS